MSLTGKKFVIEIFSKQSSFTTLSKCVLFAVSVTLEKTLILMKAYKLRCAAVLLNDYLI